jgi:ribose/xylose/arabinose/galactoside ABC-type transport system permease subunit
MLDLSAEGQFRWRPLLRAAVIGLLACTAIATCQADTSLFLNVFVVAPVLLVFTIGLVVYALIRRRQLRTILATLAVLWAIAACFFLYNREHPFAIRETARWLIWSREYKQQVLAQPTSVNGDLKHIEWDASGFAGVANNTAYLVFDPANTLSAAAKNNRAAEFNGVPCKVRAIRRLENHWYAVLFYTDQAWGECN